MDTYYILIITAIFLGFIFACMGFSSANRNIYYSRENTGTIPEDQTYERIAIHGHLSEQIRSSQIQQVWITNYTIIIQAGIVVLNEFYNFDRFLLVAGSVIALIFAILFILKCQETIENARLREERFLEKSGSEFRYYLYDRNWRQYPNDGLYALPYCMITILATVIAVFLILK